MAPAGRFAALSALSIVASCSGSAGDPGSAGGAANPTGAPHLSTDHPTGTVSADPAPAGPPAGTPAPLSAAFGRHDFEASPVGALPTCFEIATTLSRPQLTASPAKWTVVEGGASAASTRCLELSESTNRDEVFNLLLFDATTPADVALAVKLHALRGREDRGGGLVWRLSDPQNYYVARWNPLEDNLRLYRVVGGRRVQLASAPAKVARDAWHLLEVTMVGRVITVRLDGEMKLSLADSTFRDGGRAGLWTRSDACTAFDDFEVSAPPNAAQ
jgi:hypothetical protein